jgi:hypothetical protein
MWVIAVLTFVSGIVSATRMAETLPATAHAMPRSGSESRAAMPSSQPHLAVETQRAK